MSLFTIGKFIVISAGVVGVIYGVGRAICWCVDKWEWFPLVLLLSGICIVLCVVCALAYACEQRDEREWLERGR